MRDIDENPYTPDEKRVSDYIQELTKGMIGSGDDPIGFLIASHAAQAADIKRRQTTHPSLQAAVEAAIVECGARDPGAIAHAAIAALKQYTRERT